jgi:hypothetical protein
MVSSESASSARAIEVKRLVKFFAIAREQSNLTACLCTDGAIVVEFQFVRPSRPSSRPDLDGAGVKRPTVPGLRIRHAANPNFVRLIAPRLGVTASLKEE